MSNSAITNRPYQLSNYDPNWPKLFEHYAKQIKDVLGDHLIEIHHFGSTSIPGMFAKPNIDIYALADSLENVRVHQKDFEHLGFVSRGDYSNIGEEYFTLDTSSGERIASVHIFQGSPKVFDDYKSFKEYLISHEDEKERYIQLKKELYEKCRNNYPAYDEGKKQLIEELKSKARQWSEGKS